MRILFLLFASVSCSGAISQNVGIGTSTPAHKLDVNGSVNTNADYRLFGRPALRMVNTGAGFYNNLFVGDSAGFANTAYANTFIGGMAGRSNIDGYRNTFLGMEAGRANLSGWDNTYIGTSSGKNSTGYSNSFVGSGAGLTNISGTHNSFFGHDAGARNISGVQNTFLGSASGAYNTTGSFNTLIGFNSGTNLLSGHYNILLGSYTDVGGAALLNATAIGYRAYVTQSNSIVLGSINGTNGATVDTKVGIGTTAPTEKLDVNGNINLTGVLKLAGSSGTVGQVLTSNGSGSPAWRNASYGNNTRFSIRFSGNPSQNGQATIAEIFYNLNPTDVVLASPLITINRSGLYHFDFAFAANITYAVTPTIYPRFSLNLSVNSSFYYLTVNEVMIPSSNTNTNWWVNRNGSIDLHITAPTTLYLEHFYLPAGGTSHGLSGFFNGYLISE